MFFFQINSKEMTNACFHRNISRIAYTVLMKSKQGSFFSPAHLRVIYSDTSKFWQLLFGKSEDWFELLISTASFTTTSKATLLPHPSKRWMRSYHKVFQINFQKVTCSASLRKAFSLETLSKIAVTMQLECTIDREQLENRMVTFGKSFTAALYFPHQSDMFWEETSYPEIFPNVAHSLLKQLSIFPTECIFTLNFFFITPLPR